LLPKSRGPREKERERSERLRKKEDRENAKIIKIKIKILWVFSPKGVNIEICNGGIKNRMYSTYIIDFVYKSNNVD